MADAPAQQNSTPDDTAEKYQKSPEGLAGVWAKEFEAFEKETKDWSTKSDQIVAEYLDKRSQQMFASQQNHINLFWSTVEVQKATLYVRPPKVDVSRAHKDSDDDIARVAGIILERILNNSLQEDGSPMRSAVQQGIEDRLIVGLGVLWNRYEATTAVETIPAAVDEVTGEKVGEDISAEVITDEDASVDYVHWKDFAWSPARTWQEVRWVARRSWLTREAALKRFGKERAASLAFANAPKKDRSIIEPQAQAWSKAAVWEIWCKDTGHVYWWSKGAPLILDAKPVPVKLKGFFPCGKPCIANATTSRWLPRADFAMAQDLYNQINELQTRIAWITKALKVAGVYDKSAKGAIGSLFQQGSELALVPVDNWAAFAEKGGVQGVISWVPLAEMGTVLGNLRTELVAAQGHLYEVIGISDIMRGASDPNETLGAQQMKAEFGSSRIKLKQSDIADWVAASQRVRAEMICKLFQPETIKKLSNIESTPDAALADQAIAFMKDSEQVMWRITVEPDTMAAIDYAEEREARTQFLEAIGAFIERMTPLLQAAPQAAPFLMQLLKWSMGGFKIGKDIEGVMDQALQAVSQPQPPTPPSPKEQAEVQKITADANKSQASAVKTSIEAQRLTMEPIRDPNVTPADGGPPRE